MAIALYIGLRYYFKINTPKIFFFSKMFEENTSTI